MSLTRKPVRRRAFASRDPDAVRERILAAARDEFLRAGFEAASTNRITAAMGGSKATLFRYFPTKDELLEAVVRKIVSGWQDTVQSQSIAMVEPRSWLIAFGTSTLGWLLTEEPLFVGRLVIIDGKRFPSLRLIWLENATGPIHAALADKLRMWSQSGAIECGDPGGDARRFADLVFSGVVAAALFGSRPPGRHALATHVESAVDFFLRALSAVPADEQPVLETPRP